MTKPVSSRDAGRHLTGRDDAATGSKAALTVGREPNPLRADRTGQTDQADQTDQGADYWRRDRPMTKPAQRVAPDDQPSVGPRRRKAVVPTLLLLPPEHLAASDEVIATEAPAPPPNIKSDERFLLPSEAASQLRISGRTLRRYVSEGLLPAIKFKRSIRFRLSDLITYTGVKSFNKNE